MTEESTHSWEKAIAKAEDRFTEVAEADGNLVLFKREAMFAHQIISNSSYLQKCTPQSVFHAIVNVANVGITLSPAEKLAYLVPRYNKDAQATLCCLDISYRGLKKIAEDAGAVKTAVADVVRVNDKFRWVDKLTRPEHVYDPFAPFDHRGDIRGVYCIAILATGIEQVETMSLEEIEKIQNVSQAKNGPWKDWWEEMAKKSVVRRASKMWPHSARLARANDVLDQHQGLVALAAPDMPATVLGPEDAGAAPPTGGPDAPAAEPKPAKEAKPDPNADKPMQPGQVKILRARMKSAALDEAVVVEKFGAVDSWKFPAFKDIQEFIAGAVK